MKLSEITRKGSLSLLVQFIGLALSLSLNLYMTNKIGKDGYNAYALSFSWIVFLAHISLIGFDVLIMREMNNPDLSKETKASILSRAGFISFGISSLLALALFGFAYFFYQDYTVGDGRYVRPALMISAAAIPLFSMLLLLKSYMKGIKRNEVGMLPENVVRPGLLLIALICFIGYFGEISVEWIILLNIGAIFLGLLIGLILSAKGDIHRTNKTTFDKKFWKPALTFFFLSFVMMANNKADILMLGFWKETTPEVGTYNIALKLTDFVAMPLLVLNAVIAPYLVEYFKNKNQNDHLKSVKGLVRMIFAFGTVLCLGFAFKPNLFLDIFGDEYGLGAIPLIILGFGQLFNVFIGPVGNALNMANSEQIVFRVSAITLLLNLVLNAVLIPQYGLIGASIGTVVSLAIWNIILAIQLKIKHGISVSVI